MRSVGNERCGAEKNCIGIEQLRIEECWRSSEMKWKCTVKKRSAAVELRYEKHWQRTDAHRDAKEKNGLELNCQEHKSKGNAMKRPASEKKSKDWLRTVRIGKEWRIIEMLRKSLALNCREQKGGDQNDN